MAIDSISHFLTEMIEKHSIDSVVEIGAYKGVMLLRGFLKI